MAENDLHDCLGRQINLGGWANDVTYGVRLYWPDGSAGVWGVNDWPENVEVSLQTGRWYPTAMIMANGKLSNFYTYRLSLILCQALSSLWVVTQGLTARLFPLWRLCRSLRV